MALQGQGGGAGEGGAGEDGTWLTTDRAFSLCSPVVPVRVRWRLFDTLVHLRHQQTVVCMDGVTQVGTSFLFL